MKLHYKLILNLTAVTLLIGFIEYFFITQILAARITGATIFISLLPLISAAGIGAFMSYNVSSNIKQLTSTIDEISKGKLDAHVTGKSRDDEIGELARAFDRILISLKIAVEKVGIKKEELRLGEALEAKEKAERLKREAEARYKVLAQTSPDCIKLLDPRGRVTFMNAAGLSEHGFKDAKTAIGYDITAHVAKEYKPKVRNAIKRALHGLTTSMEAKNEGQHAHQWTLETFSPVKNEKGDITNILSISRDITKLKKSEAQLRAERDFVQDLIDNAGVPVIAFNRNGNLLIANNLFTELTGYTKKDIPTRKSWIKQAFPAREAHVKISQATAEFYRGKHVKDIVIPLRCKDGNTVIVVGNITCVKDETGKTTGDVLFMRDLSEIFNLEQEIRFWAENGTIHKEPTGIEKTQA